MVDESAARLLGLCDHFATSDSHARQIAGHLRLTADHVPAVAEMLDQLHEQGLLLSERELVAELAAGGRGTIDPLEHLAIVTRDRGAALRRCIEHLELSSSRHGRRLSCVISDDSDAPTAAANHAMLAARSGPLSFSYADTSSKRKFASALVAASGAPPEVIEFALFDPLGLGLTYGANRNAVLLHLAGERFLGIDDDVELELRGAGPVSPTLWVGREPATTVHLAATLDEALAQAPPSAGDPLAVIEQTLGRTIGQIAADDPDDLRFDGLTTDTLNRLRLGHGRVAVSMFGLAGDPASPVMDVLVPERAAAPHVWKLFVAAGGIPAERAALSRITERRLGAGGGLVTAAAAFDHRTLLPPMMPVLRAEDFLFAAVLHRCDPGALIAHTPWMVTHRPAPPRAFDDVEALRQDGVPQGTRGVIESALRHFSAPPGEMASRMRAMGAWLESLGRAPYGELATLVRPHLLAWLERRIERIERVRAGAADAPPSWHRFAEAYLAALRLTAQRDDLVLPTDLTAGRDDEAARVLLGTIIIQLGQLLQWWPALVASAIELRGRGTVLAPAV
ncbi:MAG TPA: hypothetical protein VML75_05725 [Kofleriaceae bacterium]|nr:hypothetical protein [Kofleriaceae bacterium]